MTTTQIISQAFGTGSNIGNFLAPTKTALQAATTAVITAVRVTLGDVAANHTSRLRVWYAVSPISYSSALVGCKALQNSAKYVEMILDPAGVPTLDLDKSSESVPTAAGYHYCWLEAPTIPTEATCIVNTQESP